jgi:hypothetical protein
MNFNPVLQSEVYAEKPVAKPSGLEAAVNVIGNTMKIATSFMENQEEAILASEVQSIIDFNEDLIGQNVGEAKRVQMIRDRVRNISPNDPKGNLKARAMLSQFGVYSGGGGGRGGIPLNEADQRARDIDLMFSSIPPELIRMFTDATDMDGLTTEDKAFVIQSVTKMESEQRAAAAAKAAATEKMLMDQTQGAIDFGRAATQEFETTVGASLAYYAKQVKGIDANNPQSSAQLEQFRNNATVSIGLYKQKVNTDFAAVMVNTTDPAVRTKLEKDKAAILKTVEDYEETFLSPTSSLDVIVQSQRAVDIMTQQYNIDNKEALAQINALRKVFGDQAFASFVNSYLVSQAGQTIALRDRVGNLMQSLAGVVGNPDPNAKFSDTQTMAEAWAGAVKTARGIRGVPTAETTNNLYKAFVASVNTMADEYVPVADRKRIMQEFDSLGMFWDMLDPAEKEFAVNKRNQLEFLTLTDARDGDIQKALQNPVLVFNKQTRLFEIDQEEMFSAPERIIPGSVMSAMAGGEAALTANAVRTGTVESNPRYVRNIQEFRDNVNASIQRMFPYLKEEILKDTGNELTDEQLLGLMGLPAK